MNEKLIDEFRIIFIVNGKSKKKGLFFHVDGNDIWSEGNYFLYLNFQGVEHSLNIQRCNASEWNHAYLIRYKRWLHIVLCSD